MRTLTVVENVSLDGVAQAPASPEEDPRGGFAHGGWAVCHIADDPDAAQGSMSGHPLLGPAHETVAALKRDGEGELVVLGSLSLVHELTAAGLVDTFVLTTVPVVLGSGTRLFDRTPVQLQVEQSWTSPRGTVVATYRVS